MPLMNLKTPKITTMEDKRIIYTFIANVVIAILAIIVAILVLLTKTKQEQPVNHPTPEICEGWHTTASYYAEPFHGRQTASGEIFNSNAFTAAHPTLPFGTYLQVSNANNNRWTIVVINDRGPFRMDASGNVIRPLEPHPTRGIDLSRAAFERIADPNDGLAEVFIQILKPY